MENNVTSSAHTAGPWEVFGISTATPEVRAVTGNMAGKQIAIVGNETESTEERAANARLIAAAPELLGALDELLSETVDRDLAFGIELTEHEQAARERALAAMEKACG